MAKEENEIENNPIIEEWDVYHFSHPHKNVLVTWSKVKSFHKHEISLIQVMMKPRKMASSWMLRRVTPVRTDVSEELSASFIMVARIGQLALFLVHRFLSP
jgi:hypothetical protein